MSRQRLLAAIMFSGLLMLGIALLSYGISVILYVKAKESVSGIINSADPDIVAYFYTSKNLKNATHVWLFAKYITIPIERDVIEYLGALYNAKIGNKSAYLYVTANPRITEGLETGAYYLIGNFDKIMGNIEITLIWGDNSTMIAKNAPLNVYPKNYADYYILDNITARHGLPVIILPITQEWFATLRQIYAFAEHNVAPEMLVLEISFNKVANSSVIVSSEDINFYVDFIRYLADEYGMSNYSYVGGSEEIFVEHPIEAFEIESPILEELQKEENHYRDLLIISGLILIVISICGMLGLWRLLCNFSGEYLYNYSLGALVLIILISIFTMNILDYKILRLMGNFFGQTTTIYKILTEFALIISAYGALAILLLVKTLRKYHYQQ